MQHLVSTCLHFRIASSHFCLCHRFKRSLLQNVVATSRAFRSTFSLPFVRSHFFQSFTKNQDEPVSRRLERSWWLLNVVGYPSMEVINAQLLRQVVASESR